MTNNTTAEVSEAMIEEVARAISACDNEEDFIAWEHNQPSSGKVYRGYATAAILAMQSERLKGDGEAKSLIERLRYHQSEAARLAQEVAGDPIQGVIIGSDGKVCLSPPSDGVSR